MRKEPKSQSKKKWEEEEDFVLCQSYGMEERMMTFGSSSNREIVDLMTKCKEVGKKGLISCITLLTDLQHPLLKKFNFDLDDFLVGAKQAFLEVTSAVYSKEVADIRAAGETSPSSTTTFLKECLTPCLYMEIVYGVLTTEEIVQSIDLQSLQVVRVRTVPVDEAFLEFREMSSKESVLRANKARSFLSLKELSEEDVNRIGLSDCGGTNYPLGSIILQVDVVCKASEERYNYYSEAVLGGSNSRRSLYTSNWTFEACVSGHVETKWIVSSFSSSFFGISI